MSPTTSLAVNGTREHQERLSVVRALLLTRAPYYAAAVFDMVPVFRPGIGTMAVDRHWRLYFDPELDWPINEQAGVLEHEVGHLLRSHADRFEGSPLSDDIVNLATDLEINDDLVAAGVPLPDFGCWPSKLGFPDGLLAEQYVELLEHQQQQQQQGQGEGQGEGEGEGQQQGQGQGQQQGQGQGDEYDGCGSGAGGAPAPWEIPADDLSVPTRTASEQAIARIAVAAAVEEHVANRGTAPAGLVRWAKRQRQEPTVRWQQELASTIRRGVGVVRGQADYTYRRPSRRRIPGAILPSMTSPTPKVAVVLDTSGSMSDTNLGDCLNEIDGIIRRAGVRGDDLRVYACDADAGPGQKVFAASKVALTGGGGTDMTVGIRSALDNPKHRPHVVVVLTDGETPWPTEPVDGVTIIAALCVRPLSVPSWIRSVLVGEAAERERCAA